MTLTIASFSLLAALRASCPEVTGLVELIETHISWVFLTGDYAFKIKKPVDFGFLDFSTLEKRRFYCEEELRLNRRTAPELYLEVVPIGAAGGPSPQEGGQTVEYALKMRRFPDGALAEEVARRGGFGGVEVDETAAVVAAFHQTIPAASGDSPYGSPERTTAPALQNFVQLAELMSADGVPPALIELDDWTRRESRRLDETFAARRRDGFVRECHGDLHLGNIAFLDGRPTPFDCIEFNADLRWIDVMNEIAFLVMDLVAHELEWAGWRFLTAYMERTGDYAGIRVLRYYLVYRAMVRAKIARLRAAQAQAGTSACDRAVAESDGYLVLAAALAGPARPSIVLMHGLSGSGKSTVAQALLEEIGAVRVRSDVERKRLHGLAAMTRTHAQPFAGIYSADDSRRTYERLEQVARDVAAAGYCIIIDAAFLQHAARERFRAVAGELGVPFLIVSCRASEETLRVRLLRREAANDDASEAGVAVLAGQLATQEPLDAVELANTVLIESEWDACRLCRAFDEVAARLSVVP